MKDVKVKRLIMENLPGTIAGQASKIYLKIAVQQDAKVLGEEVTDEQFRDNLSALSAQQMLVVFQDGFVRPTNAGLRGFNLT